MTTLRNELLAYLNTLGGAYGDIYGDVAPPDAAYPHLQVTTDVAVSSVLKGDRLTLYWDRRAQIDLWQTDGTEDETKAKALCAALDGHKLPSTGLKMRVISYLRVHDPEMPAVKWALDLEIATP